MGRRQTYVSGLAGGPLDGAGWARPYKVKWGEVVGHRVRRLRQARGWALQDMVEEDLDREFTPEQRMLLDVTDELGLAPHEAAVRLLGAGSGGGGETRQ